MALPKIIVVGAMHHNIPRQLRDHFEIVRHYQQDEQYIRGTIPQADYVLVIRNWVSHNPINTLKLRHPGIEMIWVNKGWNAMRAELERRHLLQPEAAAVTTAVEEMEDDGLTPDGAPEPAVDPIESMTEVELELATRPPEKPEEPREKHATAGPAWEKLLREWCEAWSPTAKIPASQLFDVLNGQSSMTVDLLIERIPYLDRGVARRMVPGFGKMRSNFEKTGTAAGRWVRKEKRGEAPPAQPEELSLDAILGVRGARRGRAAPPRQGARG